MHVADKSNNYLNNKFGYPNSTERCHLPLGITKIQLLSLQFPNLLLLLAKDDLILEWFNLFIKGWEINSTKGTGEKKNNVLIIFCFHIVILMFYKKEFSGVALGCHCSSCSRALAFYKGLFQDWK